MLHPEFEILSGDDDDGEAALHMGRIVPIYEAVGKLTTRVLRVLDAPHPARDCRPKRTSFRRQFLRASEAAGPLDGHPRDAFSAAR